MPDQAPYPGKLKEGDRGPAVTAVQGALHAWGAHRLKTHPNEPLIRHIGATGDFRHPTALQCGHCQQLHNIPVTNSFGPELHNVLGKWYTDAGRAILRELAHHKKVANFRAIIGYWMNATAGKRNDWRYSQGPGRNDLMTRLDPATARNVVGDCSSTGGALIKLALARAGLGDPGFGSWWTTYTLINAGRPVSDLQLLVGDRVHYGANSHVGVYMGFGRVWSFGGEPGPQPRELHYRPIYGCRRDVG